MSTGSNTRVKNQVRDNIEQGFDTMHRVADTVTFPLAAVDGAIHGVARGVLNWLTDTHPGERDKEKCLPGLVAPSPPPPPPPNPGYYPPFPHPPPAYAQHYPYAYNYYYDAPPPPPPPPLLLTIPYNYCRPGQLW